MLEIGTGPSTLIYASYLNNKNKLFVFEPQKKKFDMLNQKLKKNDLLNKVIVKQQACFCENKTKTMNNNEKDQKNINLSSVFLDFNEGNIKYVKLDDINYLYDIGFICCNTNKFDPWCFYGAKNLIKRNRPVILYKKTYTKYFENNKKLNSEYSEIYKFNIKRYCILELGNYLYINDFTTRYSLLIPIENLY